MAYWIQSDLEAAMSPATVLAIYDDANNGTVSAASLDAVKARADSEVNSYLAINYPTLKLPLTDNPTPDTIKFASLEFGIVFSRDRKPEYWRNAQENEREARLKAARDRMDRYAVGLQYHFDVSEQTKPSNVGGLVIDDGQRTILGSSNGVLNSGDF